MLVLATCTSPLRIIIQTPFPGLTSLQMDHSVVYISVSTFVSMCSFFFDCIKRSSPLTDTFTLKITKKWASGGKAYLDLSSNYPVIAEQPKPPIYLSFPEG
jgi:hypothetical protein